MKRILSIILTILLLITGCAKKTPQIIDEKRDNTPKNEKKQESYRYLYSGELNTLNYLTTVSNNEFSVVANLVDTLIDYDKYGVVKPALATNWSVSKDHLIWTFKLREGVKWIMHDGIEYGEVEAKDFVDSLEYILNSKNESATANIVYSVIKNAEKFYNGETVDFSRVGVKALDKYTLEYTLEKPTPYFLSMVTYVCFFPVNGEFLATVGDRFGTDKENLLYNGAYILDEFEPQNRRVLIANEHYWDKDNVHIKKIVATYNKEAGTLAPEIFLRGDIDYADIPSTILDEWMNDNTKKN